MSSKKGGDPRGGGGGGVEDDDFDDDDSLEDLSEESGVQLGTVVAIEGPPETVLFRNTDWHGWDGGKAGGWPVWLNPRDLPSPEDMRCGECAHPLSFLVQLYCPLDHEDDAFHRCLYVFCCPKATCSKNSSVKALRCQLPRENSFYPYDPEVETRTPDENEVKQQAGADPAVWRVQLCWVCGQLAKSACSKCKNARYCGREHQTQHWKHGGHKKACSAGSLPENSGSAPSVGSGSAQSVKCAAAPKYAVGPAQAGTTTSVFREFEVDVRPEPPPPPVAPDGRTAEDTLVGKMDMGGADSDDMEEDEDSKLSQAELDKIAGVHGVKDKVTLQFLTRTQTNPQVVRYDAAGAGPLWSSGKDVPQDADVPPCERCGHARKFEFQVMPHLLYHLGVEENTKALDPKASTNRGGGAAPPTGDCMDWGTLAVYTCPNSCPTILEKSSGGSGDGQEGEKQTAGYIQEFVWRQPPP